MRISASSSAIDPVQPGAGARRAFELRNRDADAEAGEVERGGSAGQQASAAAAAASAPRRVYSADASADLRFTLVARSDELQGPERVAIESYRSVERNSVSYAPEGELVGIDLFV